MLVFAGDPSFTDSINSFSVEGVPVTDVHGCFGPGCALLYQYARSTDGFSSPVVVESVIPAYTESAELQGLWKVDPR